MDILEEIYLLEYLTYSVEVEVGLSINQKSVIILKHYIKYNKKVFVCQSTNLYRYGFAKSKMVGAIIFLFFLSFFFFCFCFFVSYFFVFFFFFDVEPCGRKKTLTKSIKLNFLAKLKTENQRVDLNFKTSGTIFDRRLY